MADDAVIGFFTHEEWEGPPLPAGMVVDASEKIQEANYFLSKMEVTGDLDEFRWLTSAFLNSIRSCLDW